MDDQKQPAVAASAAEANAIGKHRSSQPQVPLERITLRYLAQSSSQRYIGENRSLSSNDNQRYSAGFYQPSNARKDPPGAVADFPEGVVARNNGKVEDDAIFIDASSEDEEVPSSKVQRKSASSKRRAQPPPPHVAKGSESSSGSNQSSNQKVSTAAFNPQNVRGAGEDAARKTATSKRGVQPPPPNVAKKGSGEVVDDPIILLCDSDCDNGGNYEIGGVVGEYHSSGDDDDDDDDDDDAVKIEEPALKSYSNRNGANRPKKQSKARGAASLIAATTCPRTNRQHDSVKEGNYARVGKSSKALNRDNNNTHVDETQLRAHDDRQRKLQGKDRARPFKCAPRKNHYNQAQGQHHNVRHSLSSVTQNKKRKKKDHFDQQRSFSSGTQNKERKKDHLNQKLSLSSDEQNKQQQQQQQQKQAVGQQPSLSCDAQNKESTGVDAHFRERFVASKKMKFADTSPREPYDESIVLSKLGLKASPTDTEESSLDRKPCARESSIGTPSTTTLTKSDDLSDSFESLSAAESGGEFTFNNPHEARLPIRSGSMVDHEVVIDIKERKGKGADKKPVQLSISDLQDASLETNHLAWLYRKTSLFNKRYSTKPYTKKEFEVLWGMAEGSFRMTTVGIEKSGLIRKGQGNGIYGRVNIEGMRRIFKKILRLNSDSCFLDIGHGIGNTCLQAAYTFGCEARGIEVDADRSNWGSKFHDRLNDLVSIHEQRGGVEFRPGKVKLRVGSLKDDIYRKFQVEGVNAVFVNNYSKFTCFTLLITYTCSHPPLCPAPTDGVFSGFRDGVNLDSHIAGLFAMMKPGTIMATLHDLRSNIGHSQKTVTEKRKSRGLPNATNINASFFEYEEVSCCKYFIFSCKESFRSSLKNWTFFLLHFYSNIWVSKKTSYPGAQALAQQKSLKCTSTQGHGRNEIRLPSFAIKLIATMQNIVFLLTQSNYPKGKKVR